MSRLRITLIFILSGCIGSAPNKPVQQYGSLSERSVLLSEVKAKALTAQCSRWSPRINGTWQPKESDIVNLEIDLKKIVGKQSTECCYPAKVPSDLNQFIRQYVGVQIGHRRYIYMNAFPFDTFEDLPPQAIPDWKHEPIVYCDGGAGSWGVLYDPNSRKFKHLAFNGIG